MHLFKHCNYMRRREGGERSKKLMVVFLNQTSNYLNPHLLLLLLLVRFSTENWIFGVDGDIPECITDRHLGLSSYVLLSQSVSSMK